MGSLTGCLKTHAAVISDEDRKAIIERRRVLMTGGMKATPAAIEVVRDLITQTETTLDSLPAEAAPELNVELDAELNTELAGPTEAELQAQAEAQARAQAEADAAAKAAAEARRELRETEREVYRALVANPELVGMSLKNVEALVQAKVGDALSPEKRSLLARAIVKQVAKNAAELAKQKNRDPAVFGAALGAAKQQDNVPEDAESQAAYALGWTHALQGKTKSTLTGDLMGIRVAGYDAAKAWMQTEEGAAWYEGRPVNKLQNTGLDLRRWYEQLRDQMKADESDIKKAWKQIERATTRSDLFAPLLPDGVSPGFTLYVTELRDLVRPFKAWLESMYYWSGYEGGKRNNSSGKSNVDYMLAGDRYPVPSGWRAPITEADSDKFQDDEAFRAEWLRQRAADYIEQVRTITSVIEGSSSVAEAAQKWEERFIKTFSDKRWNLDSSMLTPAGLKLVSIGREGFDAWSGETSDVMQFSHQSAWSKGLIEKEHTAELPSKATPLRPPRLDKIVRDGGPDLRKGADVTPEQFKAAFGLADVGFGKWVGAKEDQDHLNYSFDAFHDLARHFGVDPKHLGFNGALHFTVGALGHGKHAAHFSPNQPSPVGPVQVINVTNTKGDGTVYHEWIHALDHNLFGAHFSVEPNHPVRNKVVDILLHGVMTPESVEKRARDFLVGGWHWQGNKRMDKVDAAMLGLRNWNRSETAYKRNADALGKDYWGTNHELLARASEAWAYDTLGHASTYLVNPWVADGKVTQAAGYRGTPYPTGAERKQFNLVLAALAKAIKWTDGKPSVTLADFEAALPDELKAGERRRQELLQPENMRALHERILAERADAQAQAERDKAEAAAEEQRRLDELAEQKLKALETPAVVDGPQPSETQGPLSDQELNDIFDQAAAELREETQEQPDVPATAEPEITRPEWTAEDWRAVHRVLAKGTPVLLAQEGHGIPTIHEFSRLGKTDMVGFGAFKTVGDGWTANWDGGGAMAQTPSGMAYTTVQFSDGTIPPAAYNMQAAADAALANARALESVSSVSSVPAPAAPETVAPGQMTQLERDIAASGRTPEKSPKTEPTSRETADPTARDLIAKAAELGVKGADEALTGLAKLFGAKPGRLNSFPAGFDEEAYNEAKPHFKAALKAFQEAGKTLKDLFKFLIQNLGDGVKMYAIQFAKDEGLTATLAPQDKTAKSMALARDIERHLLHVPKPMDWRTLFNMADRVFGGTQAQGTYTPKDAYDALEAAINLRILRSPTLFTPGVNEEDAQRTVAALTRLLEKVPTQTKRTEEQDRMQQFSTVPPLAFVANWVAGVRSTDVMLEPSGGLGGLAVFAKNAGAKVVLNEYSSRRAAMLQQLFPDSRVFQEDAEQLHNILPDDVQPTVVVMNPPFSNSVGGIKDTMTGANHVEQALKRLPDGGRLVAIVGEGMAMDKAAFKGWWKKIGARYDVRAAIPMDGKGYAKYGTTFDNVILVIDKVAPSGRAPVVTPAKEYTELVHLLAGVRNDRPAADVPQQDHSLEPDARGGAGEGVPAGDGPAVPAGAETGDGGAAGVGPGQPGGEPGVGGSGASGAAPRGGRRPRGAAGGDTTAPTAADPNANGSGAADAGQGGGPGAAGNATGLSIESAATAAASGELTDSVFEGYQPKFLRIPGARPHPTALVESAAMASVNPPRPTYTPNLPKETIEKGLVSLAQLESTVYAGQAHSQLLETKVGDVEARDFSLTPGVPYRRGFFIGDGTGVGKGREISSIILDNVRQGRKKHVWVSEKQGLMNDAVRDFAGIQDGVTEHAITASGQLFNLAKRTEAGTWKVNAADGILYTTYATLRSAQKFGNFESGDEVETKDGRTGMMTSISVKAGTVNVKFPGDKKTTKLSFDDIEAIDNDTTWRETVGKKPPAGWKPRTRIDQIVEWLGTDFDGVIAFDEAHNAGNAIEIKGEMGKSEPSAQAVAVVELQRRLPNARVVYVSATGATEVSNLSFATRLGIWGPGTPFSGVQDFVSNMEAGGLATMELVARDLKQTGSYLARSLSYDGVKYDRLEHELSEDQHAIYNRMTDAWQVVLNNMEEAMKATGILSESGKTKNSKAKSAALSAFWGAQQRFFNQIITSMQMPSVLESVQADIDRGDAVVLQLVNTNEAQQERAMNKKNEEGEATDLEDLDLTPRDALIGMVRKAFPVNQYVDKIDENGKRVSELALDSEGKPIQNKEMVAKRDALIKDLIDIKVPDGPLELLINAFGPEVVAEITGRKQRVVSGKWNKTHKGEGAPPAFVQKLGAAKVKADAKAFMDDKKRILVFSDAGGTGFSFQADLGKANQRQRQHYLIQPGWRANKAVQGLGRTHRTNQKSPPHYWLVATNIPAHKRFLSSIARRLDQLGALTKGQRDTSSGGLFSEKDNLESKYAERAVRRFLDDARIGQIEGVNFNDLLQQLGMKDMINPETKQITESKVPGVRQFLNRLLSLSLEMQDKVFGAFIARMEQIVEEAAERGELDTGMQTIRALETKVVSEDTIYTDERTGAETKLVEIEATHPTRIYDFPTIKEWEKDGGYVVNVRSGRVWKRVKSGTSTMKDGRVVEKYHLQGTGGNAWRTEDDFGDKAGWKTITEAEARDLWAKENAAKPPTYTTRENMIVGAMLPIWDRLKTEGVMQVARTQTKDGRRLLGRVVHKDDIAELRKRLNLAAPESKLPPAEVLARVLKGEVAELANNWRLERARVSDDLRVEIKGMPSVGPALQRELTEAGVISERIQWNTRYFVPTDKPEVLATIIKSRPVVALAKPSEQPKLSQLKQLPAGQGVPVDAVREMAARVAEAWADNPQAPALYVVESAYRLPRDILASLSNMGAVDTTRGLVMPDGRVFLVADKLRSIDEAQSILFHEVYGHMGLRAFLGEQYGAQMMLLRMANPRLAGEANTWYANYGRGQINARVKAGMSREEAEREVRLLAVEEALADRAGDAPPPSAWKALMAKLQEALRRMGLDNVANWLERMSEAETHALLMNARRAIDRTGGPMHTLADLPATMQPKRAGEAPPFYSALLAEVNKAPMKAGPASAWGQYLDALAKKGAVKADEIEWTGLREWLQMQEGKVTKDQVGQYLAANGVQVTETVLGGGNAMQALDASVAEAEALGFRFDRDVFEEGDEYLGRTVQFTRRRDDVSFRWNGAYFEVFDHPTNMNMDSIDAPDDGLINVARDISDLSNQERDGYEADGTKYGQYTLPGGTNYREVLLTLPAEPNLIENGDGTVTRSGYAKPVYASNHWDQPNILAHIRLNDRTDADGKRVLFVEEIQSDWAQEGKKKGFAPAEPADFAVEVKLVGSWHPQFPEVRDKWRVTVNGRDRGYIQAADENEARYKATANEQNRRDNSGKPPAAPFVGKTDAWVALAIKRVISIAAREGYDRVAFVNGDQSAERYDLSKQVKSIDVERYDLPGVGPVADVRVIGLDGRKVHNEDGASMDRIADLVGKEIAERIAAQPPETRKQYAGDGLKVGGEGMRAFYDKIVPAVAKDVLRKVGGGQMGAVQIGAQREISTNVDDGAGGVIKRRESTGITLQQPGFDITPAMREKAAAGLPLFKQVRNRADVAWSRVDRNTEGPEFYGNGVGLIAIQQLSVDDFAPDHLALPLGHAYRVREGHTVHRFLVTDDTGSQVLGIADLEVDGSGQIEAIHDIEIDAKGAGTGRRVVEAILASAPGEVRLIDIVDGAAAFWDRMGAGYKDVYGDATTDWAALQSQDARAVPGARPRAGQGLEAGRPAEGQLRGGQEGGPPLLSQTDPHLESALKKAGIRPALTLGEKIRAFYGRAVEAVRHRGEIGDELRQGLLDQFYGIQRAVVNEIGNLPVEQNPAITARLANGGTSSVMRGLMMHGQARWAANGQHLEKIPGTVGLLDIFKPLGSDLDLFFAWMVGNRAARLMNEGRENNLTADEIAALQALGTPERLPAFQKAAREYAAFKRSVLDVAQQAGLIDGEARKAWDHADYIPFYREIDSSGTLAGIAAPRLGRKGLSGQSSGIRKLRGGESALNDPMENLLMNFSRLIDASLKNNAIRKTIQTLGETDLVTKVGYDMAPAFVPRQQVVDVLAAAGTPDSILASLPDEVYEGISKMWAIKAPTDPDVVRVMMGGKPVFFRVNDPLLLASLTSFVPFDFPGSVLMRGAKRLLTAMVTSTPEFMARNWIRDSMAAQAITKTPFNPLKSVLAIREAYKEGPGYEAMLFAGASFQSGNVNAGDPEETGVSLRRALRAKGLPALAKEVGVRQAVADKALRTWEHYRKGGEAIENANREAVYEAAVRSGKSVTEAAFEAKDLMDFSLRGSWAGYQFMADVLPFFNARVQGLYRLGRSDPKRLMMVGTMMMVATAVLALMNSGEDWYEALPDWEKDGYWHIMTPVGRFKIPKPFELGVIFATIPERIARNFMGLDSNSKTISRLRANVRDQLAFDPVPQLVRPGLNTWANKDTFRDRDIEGMADEGKRPHARYDARTSDTMRVLADVGAPVVDWADLGPKKLEYLVNGYFGTVGMWGLSAADAVVRAAEDKPVRPAHRLDDLPMIRAFYAEDPPKATVFESDVYKMRREVKAIVREARAMAQAQEMAKAKALLKEEAAKIKAYGKVVGGAKSLTALNKQISQVYADPKLDADQKRAKVDKLLEQKAKLAQKVVKSPDVQAAF